MSGMKEARDRVNDELDRPVGEWLASGDFELDTEPRQVSIVFSARMPAEWSARIMTEVARRGLDNPSQLIRAFVEECLERAETTQPDPIMLVHRARTTLEQLERQLERGHAAA